MRRSVVGLILARGGSKGIKKKNIRLLSGVPLLIWVLRPMIDSGIFYSIWVSTDDNEIAEVATAYGAQIHYRTKETAKDSTSSLESIQEFLKHHTEVDVIALVQCTSPIIHPSHLAAAHNMMLRYSYDSVFSVVRQHKFKWKEIKLGESTEPTNFDIFHRPRRQDWPGELVESGHFYFTTTDNISKGLLQGGKCGYLELPEEMCVDIDSESDWLIAEKKIKLFGYKVNSKLWSSIHFCI